MDHVLLILSVKTSPTTAGDFYLIADVVVSSPPLSPFSGPSGKSLRRVSGGFFLACEYFFFENVRPFIHRLRLLSLFFNMEISSRTLIPRVMPGSVHSGSAS